MNLSRVEIPGGMTSLAATQFLPQMATAGAAKQFLVVSIHDVAPENRETVQKIISELAQLGVRTCSLLVVPDYHHRGSFTQDQQFVSWLRGLEADGHEIVLHGYFHQRPAAAGENLRKKFVTQIYTQNEGEFFDLDYNEAFRRITMGRDEFQSAGFKPNGFVAPAWLLNEPGERAARDAGFEYTTRLGNVVDLRSNETFPARSLVYSVRNGWRRATSLVWNAALARTLEGNELLRMSIHPPDYLFPAIWRQIADLIGSVKESRRPTTYQDWIEQRRIRSRV